MVSTATPFEAWIQANFTAGQRADPNISGPEADPDNDGILYLLEFAFSSYPMANQVGAGPVGEVIGGFGTLTYTRNKLATDLSYVVEASSGLGTWVPVAEQRWQVTDGPTTERVTARDSVSVESSPARFMRLKVTLQP